MSAPSYGVVASATAITRGAKLTPRFKAGVPTVPTAQPGLPAGPYGLDLSPEIRGGSRDIGGG